MQIIRFERDTSIATNPEHTHTHTKENSHIFLPASKKHSQLLGSRLGSTKKAEQPTLTNFQNYPRTTLRINSTISASRHSIHRYLLFHPPPFFLISNATSRTVSFVPCSGKSETILSRFLIATPAAAIIPCHPPPIAYLCTPFTSCLFPHVPLLRGVLLSWGGDYRRGCRV